jgi:hypothetical protein
MKIYSAARLAPLLLALYTLCAQAQQYTNKYSILITLDGAEYEQAAPKRREGNTIVVFHAYGIEKVPIEQLPDNVLQDIGLPTSVDRARQAEDRARRASEKEKQEQELLSVQKRMAEEEQNRKAIEAAKAPKFPTKVTKGQYNRIDMGMSYSQIVAILGPPHEELSSSEMMGTYTVMYMWEGTSLDGNMNVILQDGKVIHKAQFGLEY